MHRKVLYKVPYVKLIYLIKYIISLYLCLLLSRHLVLSLPTFQFIIDWLSFVNVVFAECKIKWPLSLRMRYFDLMTDPGHFFQQEVEVDYQQCHHSFRSVNRPSPPVLLSPAAGWRTDSSGWRFGGCERQYLCLKKIQFKPRNIEGMP